MKIEQLYTGCLAEAAYYIESEGEAVIIDPLRETKPYLDRAAMDGATIKYVLETHFHADFVSGHIDLAKATGATIVFGPTAQPQFQAHVATDGEILKVGKVTIKVLHTPGHTMESSSFLLRDENGKDYAVFTGDTLFIGDVGRPDLAVKSDVTREDLAGLLFDSLRNKIMTLADEVIVYPGHGAGSACGKKMAKETESTIGLQKSLNYALRADITRDEFVTEVTTGLVDPPQYFPKNAAMNKMGYDSFETVLQRGIVPRSTIEFDQLANQEGALLLDVRPETEFVKGFIPNSISIGIDGQFASWVGTLITDLRQPILLIVPEGREEEAVTRLSRVGYDNCLGYLNGGFDAWKKSGNAWQTIESIDADTFAVRQEDTPVIDVRKQSEFEAEHVVGAKNVPLDFLNNNMEDIDRDRTYLIHCAGGYRSVIAISILMARGYDQLVNVEGGLSAIKKTGKVPVTAFKEQITAL